MCVPQTSTATGPPRVEAVHELRGRVDELRLAAGVAVVGDLVGEVPRQHARVGPGLHDVQAHAAQPLAAQVGRRRRPRAGRVDRADALPDEDARRVEALEQRRVERMLAAGRVRPDRVQPADDRVHVVRAQRVAAALGVLLDRRAAQDERRAVEQQAPARPADLAEPDLRPPAGLARDGELERLQRRVAGAQRFGCGDVELGAQRRRAPAAELDRRERQRRAPRRPVSGASARRRGCGPAR